MRILIDTNILIHLEDNKVVQSFFSKFYKLAIENQCKILYHPIVLNDIENDNDLERKKIILSKLAKYSIFESPETPTNEFTQLVGENNKFENIRFILNVFKNMFDFFKFRLIFYLEAIQ